MTEIATDLRRDSPEPPRGRQLLAWLGPGLIWMVSSVGSGTVLFTPRVGSRYGYELLWMMLAVTVLMWVIIHEVGRYTTVTGKTILNGYSDLPGPQGWAVWLIFVPQIVAAVTTIAGIAALLGSVLMNALPGDQLVYSIGIILLTSILVISGRYKGVERTMSLLAAVLVAAGIIAATAVFPGLTPIVSGFVPGLPEDMDFAFVLPWVGFLLAGAAGVMWFSYWTAARGYGGSVPPSENPTGAGGPPERLQSDDALAHRLKKWQRVLALAAGIGVVGAFITNLAFIILGTELLRPEGIIPEGIEVAEDLTLLLSEIWGAAGMWILTIGMVVALWGTIISNIDGWPRLFTDATLILFGRSRREEHAWSWLRQWISEENASKVRLFYITIVATVFPLILFLMVRNPVNLLSVAGSIAAAHMPFVVVVTMMVNHRRLPKVLRPGMPMTALAFCSAIFFLTVAGMQLFG
jgi:Mn2+/Fe2+ NRAMP family transporter